MVDVRGKRANGSTFVKKVERSAGRVELEGDAVELDLPRSRGSTPRARSRPSGSSRDRE